MAGQTQRSAPSRKQLVDAALALSRSVSVLAQRLKEEPVTTEPEWPLPSEQPAHAAARILAARRRRAQHFPRGWFGEPAFDVVLDLYVARHLGRSVSVSSACIASGVAPTTGLRWITKLQEEGWIRRVPCCYDSRVSYLELEPERLPAIEAWLSSPAATCAV